MKYETCSGLSLSRFLLRLLYSICLILALLLWGAKDVLGGPLADRLTQFPNWDSKPPVQVAKRDLIYPNWMAGTWNVTSTLVDLVAPLAPEIVTPGFEGNRRYLNQFIEFQVRFVPMSNQSSAMPHPFFPIQTQGEYKGAVPRKLNTLSVVADRSFNGLKIAEAYLGDRSVLSVKVDPNNPNRQITLLPGERQLISAVTERGSETSSPDQFVATEVSQQVFRGETQIYFNEVETTTAYQLLEPGKITGNQVTAIYLSPQDPDYFAAARRPVALYRYQLELLPEK